MADKPVADRIRQLLLSGDNVVKNQGPEALPRARASFEQARELARDPSVDPRVRELVERRLAALDGLG